jgi:hypothetical protein
MKRTPAFTVPAAFAILIGILATLPVVAQQTGKKPAGKLILFSDLAVFEPPGNPENCTVKNRFKRGDAVGFRLYAVDGGTGQPDVSAKIVVHINFGGKRYDLRALYRGIPQKNDKGATMPVHAGMWTAKWYVPGDAPTGTVEYSATATDKYGRMVEWTPPGGEPSFLTIVQ